MQTLAQWLKSPELAKLKSGGSGKLFSKEFFRDPLRPIFIDPCVFYAPADGPVLYAEPELAPDEPILWVKGRKFTVRDLLDDPDYKEPSMVVGIFMTQYNVHVNRVPTSGYLIEQHRTPYLFTPNVSMIMEEQELVEDGHSDPEDMAYLFANQRTIVSIYSSKLKDSYYLIQIAERDVDEILNFGERKFFTQGERYGIVHYGSQVDFVLPLDAKHEYELLVKKNDVVAAGVDPIVRIAK